MNEEKTNINENEILISIKEQIVSFDNKASILITVLGIIFALSFSTIDLLVTNNYNWWVYLFFGLYMLCLIISICLSLCVIMPRGRKKSRPKSIVSKSCTYYGDLKDMAADEFDSIALKETNFEQIRTNSLIAWKKQQFVRVTIFSLIPVCLFFIALIILILI